MLKEKRRILEQRRMYLKRTYRDSAGVPTGTQVFDYPYISHEITQTEGHRWPKDRGVRDAGGPFLNLKFKYDNPDRGYYGSDFHNTATGYWQSIEGNAIPWDFAQPRSFIEKDHTTDWYQNDFFLNHYGSLDVLGTKYISRTIPTNPVVDGSVSLAELFREGIPSMVGSILLKERANFFRSIGSEYLNVEFGWKPLIADLRNAAKAIHESEKIMQNLVANSGKDLHRHSFTPVDTETSVSSDATGNNMPSWQDNSQYLPQSWYTSTDQWKVKSWFSGCYTYYIDPATMSQASRIATEARLLYGLQITPEVLWNLAPWSWLVDWFANVGPMLHNVSAFQSDGLVLKYGYVMENVKRSITRRNTLGYRGQNPNIIGYSTFPHRYYERFYGEQKRRARATPFGFGLNSVDFTTRQWAILGALGLTRAPKTL